MEEQAYLYAPMEPVKTESVQCGGAVRWTANGLEQLWIITEFTGGSMSGRRDEWRPVPTV